MEKLTQYAPLAARLMMAVLFLMAGIGKLGDVAGFAGFLTSGGLPAFLAWPATYPSPARPPMKAPPRGSPDSARFWPGRT